MRTSIYTLIAAGCLFGAARAGSAGSFQVTPLRVDLDQGTTSALVTLRNSGTERVRVQISIKQWGQGAGGEMQLGLTQDVVCFPLVLDMAPGEDRNVRVGRQVPPGPTEKTYRIFAQELPPLRKKSGPKANISVLTRIGVPIFIAPTQRHKAVSIGDVTVSGGAVSFKVRNTGNLHYLPSKFEVIGRTADGQQAFEQSVPGWYILAGGERVFSTKPGVPSGISSVDIEAIADDNSKVKSHLAIGR